jgi:hypothetical protein
MGGDPHMAVDTAVPQPTRPGEYKKRRWKSEKMAPLLFVSPFIIAFIVLFLGPAIYALTLAFSGMPDTAR